ncbi:adenylate/guanylate cyclase domain-containing protein [Stappia sp. F7233]|uniref:Adenylate/guanylate cyclase domain-containing protein n=1 Tax=Stappia albiluteola TaxID=2758565 RepID=A0A839AI00_9HYPH|nr:adenylate/guanylate cyclase domain-containing protein [Stappia albiluteola]MBA5779351.1 adenylate/guanylate cyclase domain-containing protein [Stappia albiluteola]
MSRWQLKKTACTMKARQSFAPLDPAPRDYPRGVVLLRRSARGRTCAPDWLSIAEFEEWLLTKAVQCDDLLELFEDFVWRLVACGLPVDRSTIHIGTLHPLLMGFAYNWNVIDGLADEMKVDDSSRQTGAFLENTLYRVIELGERLRIDISDPEQAKRFPITRDLASQGFTDYVAVPLVTGGAYHNAATLATRQSGGLRDDQVVLLRRLFQIFALHLERQIALKVAANSLETYLGGAAAGKVLGGTIRRGSGEPIRAILWVSDLRGFTDLSDHVPAAAVTEILNAYFEQMAGAVIACGGEVLKFIGDGLLAVFPFEDEDEARQSAQNAVAAARMALAGITMLNEEKPGPLDKIDGWHPLRTGIALHEGEAFFGNVGSPDRLDFTVIGQAVNLASRTESLTKELGHAVLLTEPVAMRLDETLRDFGAHRMRGLSAPVRIFGLR